MLAPRESAASHPGESHMSRCFRLLAGASALACLLLAGATALVQADAQLAGSLQTVTGSTGYRYQIPSDWQQLPSQVERRMGDQSLTADGEAVSVDGKQHAHVETATGLGVTSDHLSDALAAFLGIGQGGSIPGLPPISTLAGPDSIQVSNADSAMTGAVTYKDASGADRVVAARIATKGGTTYVLALDVTQDFYQNDPSFGAIMSSFQLSGS
jgi:hypothetical protein